jgi:hypothetical protein
VLLTPVLAQRAFFWIAFVVAVSFILSAPLSWLIAPLMMQRFVRARQFH